MWHEIPPELLGEGGVGGIPSVDAALRRLLRVPRTAGTVLSTSGNRYRLALSGKAFRAPGAILWPFNQLGRETGKLFRIWSHDERTGVAEVEVTEPARGRAERALLYEPNSKETGGPEWWSVETFSAAMDDLENSARRHSFQTPTVEAPVYSLSDLKRRGKSRSTKAATATMSRRRR